ncbi:T9SS type A sorting domain-containing protein [Kaistella palustris]|uniref:T9SS type A sorting domain-containing protein n=1 Tax=Kaistella palustris TaxID=493376 RepID=UPI000A038E84|nr:T9SS type A sorting domain-containing protein [Kaistella palustris]
MKRNFLSLLFICVFSTLMFSQTAPPNTRLFQPTKTQGYYANSFIKHLTSAPDEIYQTVSSNGGYNYYGQAANIFNTKYITRIGKDGIPIWHAKFIGQDDNYVSSNVRSDFACVDPQDNITVVFNTSSPSSAFTDAAEIVENFTFNNGNNFQKIIVRLDKNGNKIWTKQIANCIAASLIADSSGNIYVVGVGGEGTATDGMYLGKTFILKLNGDTGNILYSKSYGLQTFQFIPVLDSQDNLYVFTEPMNDSTIISYVFDGVTIASNPNALDNIMLKFNADGNVIWGKNFYTDNAKFSYSWMNDAVCDGTHFVVMGNLFKDSVTDENYVGLGNVLIPATYLTSNVQGFIAKIDFSGNVIWQKAIATSKSTSSGFYTNINVDENKNIYGYFNFKDKIFFDNTEYVFDAVAGNKVLTKFDSNGNVKYLRAVDSGGESGAGVNYYHSRSIDVMGNDKLNVSAVTWQNSFLNYTLTNTASPKYYLATFGNLDSKYLTAEDNFLSLSNVEITNNPENNNVFSFDSVNNVNWTAASDQSRLSLTFIKLAEKNAPSNTISDFGDAKISLTAETNNTGATRTANVLLSGDGAVAAKTIAVTQSGILATGETKAFVTTLYPNPTSDILNIETQQRISKIEIFDLSGKLLKTADGGTKQVSVALLTKGMYLIKLYTEKGVVNSKFMKN